MDSLKSLYDAKQYELILKLTAKSENESDLFYRIGAFTGLGQYEEALFVIQDHQHILENDLAALIPIHIDLLCSLERYDQAYSVLDYYSNLPYQSQVVEELLVSFKDIIAKEEKKQKLYTLSDDEVSKNLLSNDKENVLYAIDLIKKRDIFTFLPDLVKVMTTNESQSIRSLTLMLLAEKEVDRELPFLSYNGPIKVNPKKIRSPFAGDKFTTLVNRITREFKDLTLSQNGVQILSNLVIHIYPEEINGDLDEILLAVLITSKKYIGMAVDDISIEAKNKGLNEEKVIHYFNLINNALND